MPLLKEINIENHTHGFIWELTEDENFFVDKLPERVFFDIVLRDETPKRRIEILAGKFLIYTLSEKIFTKDKYNKPFLEDSNYFISLSHSKNLIFALCSKYLCGIDIQYFTNRIERIAWRVMSDEKAARIDKLQSQLHWHIYWCAKESLYKAYGKRGLNFKNEIKIIPFDIVPEAQENPFLITEGSIDIENFSKNFLIYFNTLQNNLEHFALVIALEKK